MMNLSALVPGDLYFFHRTERTEMSTFTNPRHSVRFERDILGTEPVMFIECFSISIATYIIVLYYEQILFIYDFSDAYFELASTI